jgi:hypothetical protein
MESVLKRIYGGDFRRKKNKRIIRSLKNKKIRFLKGETKIKHRKRYERKFKYLQRRTIRAERKLNSQNYKFKVANKELSIRRTGMDPILNEIKNKKGEKKKLIQYVIDGEQRFKFEANKVWFYSILNIGGAAAVLYMVS